MHTPTAVHTPPPRHAPPRPLRGSTCGGSPLVVEGEYAGFVDAFYVGEDECLPDGFECGGGDRVADLVVVKLFVEAVFVGGGGRVVDGLADSASER